MLYRLIILICLNLAVSAVLVTQASDRKIKMKLSQPDIRNFNGGQSKKRLRVISKGSAIKIAKSQVRGKVLSARLIRSKGPAVYRVKMLVGDSRVRTVFVDGVSRKVIRIN